MTGRIENIKNILRVSKVFGGEYHTKKVEEAIDDLEMIFEELKDLRKEKIESIWNDFDEQKTIEILRVNEL